MKTTTRNIKSVQSKRGRSFLVFGRALPSEATPSPVVIAVRVIAPNEAVARSRFWKLNKRDHKLKKANGEVIKVQEIHEKKLNTARNFGIFLKYRSHTGVQNMFKEFRDVSQQGAIDQMYNEMGGNYRASSERVDIIRLMELSEDQLQLRNPRCKQWSNASNINYALWKRHFRSTEQKYASNFSVKKPSSFITGVSVNK